MMGIPISSGMVRLFSEYLGAIDLRQLQSEELHHVHTLAKPQLSFHMTAKVHWEARKGG
jgi:hypothetical protein